MSRSASPPRVVAIERSAPPTEFEPTHSLSSADPSRPPAPADQTALVTSALPLVGHLVRELLGRVPSHVNRDDLTSAGMMALVLSAQSFDASRGVPFSRFAAIRIRGALTDELRSMDWAARSVRGRAREAGNVQTQLTAALGRTPTKDEIASAMGVSAAELDSLRGDVNRANVLSLQGFAPETGAELVPDRTAGPEALLLSRERLGYLHDAIEELPERLRTVVVEYFYAQRQMSDIAAELGVTESRVSQMRSEALKHLRGGMNSQLEPTVREAAGSNRSAAAQATYFAAIARRSTLTERLARTSATGEVIAALAGRPTPSHGAIA